MALAPANSPYLLASLDVDLPQARKLSSIPTLSNIELQDGGPGATYTINTVLNLRDLANMSTISGMVASTAGTMVPRTLGSDGSINIADGDGRNAAPYFSVIDRTTTQFIDVSTDGVPTTNRTSLLNFISGVNASVNAVYNGGASRTDITINAAPSIPADGSVVYAAATTGHAFDLGTLTTGLLKMSVAANIATPATAVANVDYMVPTASLVDLAATVPLDGEVIICNGGVWQTLAPGLTGQVLGMTSGSTNDWIYAVSTDARFLCQTGDYLPAGGINIGQPNGRVGIGTTAPAYSLDVLCNEANGSPFFLVTGINVVTDPGAIGESASIFANYGGSSNIFLQRARGTLAAPLRIQSGDVLGGIRMAGAYAANNAAPATLSGTQASILAVAADNFEATSQPTRLNFYTTSDNGINNARRMTIDSTGFVGIGLGSVNEPAYPLDVLSFETIALPFDMTVGINVTIDTGSPKVGGSIFTNFGGSSNIILLQARGRQAVPRRSLSGDILGGIRVHGSYAPDDVTDSTPVLGAAGGVVSVALEDFVAGSSGARLDFYTTPVGADQAQITVDMRGGAGVNAQLGIGMVPTTQLELFTSTAQKSAGTTWTNPSDKRIKTDITEVEDALSVINGIIPRKFRFTKEHIQHKKDEGRIHAGLEVNGEGECDLDSDTYYYGYIADEVEKVLPKCVTVTKSRSGEHENIKTLDISDLSVYVVQAVRELSAKVVLLEAKLGL